MSSMVLSLNECSSGTNLDVLESDGQILETY
jgi:hypothetical protein